MIIGVMSDTHGYLTEMRRVAGRMLEEFFVDAIIHLGDDSTDADELAGLVPEIYWVPGVFEPRYRDKNIPKRIIHKFEGVSFLLTHTPTRGARDVEGDIDPTAVAQDGDARVVLYGHTHMASIEEKHGAIFVNPGHLKEEDSRGENPSFAIIEIVPPKLTIRIVESEGGVRLERIFRI